MEQGRSIGLKVDTFAALRIDEFMDLGRYNGVICGVISSATFGLIPLFTVPVLREGMSVGSILFYRYTFAAVFIGLYVLIRRHSVRISRSDIPTLIALVALAGLTALFLLTSYQYITSGIATTIHFLYPVVVTVLMVAFFGERSSVFVWGSIAMALAGVAMLSTGGGGVIDLRGLMFVLMSVATYALYIIGVNKSRIRTMGGIKMTFYVLTLLSAMFFVNAIVHGGIEPLPSVQSAINLAMLGLVPTLVSNLTLIIAIKHIGSTTTAILGSMEPVTAVVVGVAVFHEPFSEGHAMGILLVIAAVTTVILAKRLSRESIRKLIPSLRHRSSGE